MCGGRSLRHVALLCLLPLAAGAATHRGRGQALDRAEAPPAESLGPDGCVSLSRSAEGTCVISTDCAANTSDTEFAFVCFNPGSSVPHALHSFGRGGFAPEEAFDTGVSCGSCTSVEYALSADGPLLRSSLAAPGGEPSMPYEEPLGSAAPGNASAGALSDTARRVQTAFYGPSSCIATFLSPRGTCVIETKCNSVPGLADFTVGLTCLDQTGDYTRYLFGKGSFQPEETFDSTLRCQACLGVGDEPVQQLRSMVPKLLVQDVTSLKEEVRMLRGEVTLLRQSYGSRPGVATVSGNAANATSVTNGTGGSEVAEEGQHGTGRANESAAPVADVSHAEATLEPLAPAPSLARAPASSLPEASEASLAAAPSALLPRQVHARPSRGAEASLPPATARRKATLTVRDLLRRLGSLQRD